MDEAGLMPSRIGPAAPPKDVVMPGRHRHPAQKVGCHSACAMLLKAADVLAIAQSRRVPVTKASRNTQGMLECGTSFDASAHKKLSSHPLQPAGSSGK
jgi:hypothetical protein